VAIDYRQRTMVTFCGKVLCHGDTHAQGKRLVYAYFMQEGVQHRSGIKAPHWRETSYYEQHIGVQ
ncbi:hypothetical protein BKA93DRAFT_745272, partial [Sparassis latifolia]